MTGTGIQTDPYIVENWTEFVQVCGTADAYVKFADGGGIIDFKGSRPASVPLKIYAHVDGNGWVLKNAYFNNVVGFDLYGIIENLKIIDFYVLSTTGTARLLRMYGNGNCFVENCIFTGEISGKYSSSLYAAMIENGYNDAGRISMSRCAFSLKVGGGISINANNNVVCDGCIFDVDSSDNEALYPFYNMNFRNCLVQGEYQNLTLAGGFSRYSIFDVNCPSVISGGHKSHFVIGNSDKSSYDENYFYTATTEQLKNADHLRSIGFSVGDGEMEINDVSEFEQGGFYIDTGQEYSNSKEIRSSWFPIKNTVISVECAIGDVWSFVCRDSDGSFHNISESSGYKDSGQLIDLSKYPWISEIRIEIKGALAITPSYKCRLRNGYPWTIKDEMLLPVSVPEADSLGAFANAENLVEVLIPKSVKKIGRYSFKNTKLKSVMISRDCTYYPTSFPPDCTVNFYPD